MNQLFSMNDDDSNGIVALMWQVLISLSQIAASSTWMQPANQPFICGSLFAVVGNLSHLEWIPRQICLGSHGPAVVLLLLLDNVYLVVPYF